MSLFFVNEAVIMERLRSRKKRRNGSKGRLGLVSEVATVDLLDVGGLSSELETLGFVGLVLGSVRSP